MSRQRLVVVGNGMAPGRALERLVTRAPDTFDITIFNAEPRVNYDRIMLSPVLAGEKSYEDIIIHDDTWYAQHGITLNKGRRVAEIDRLEKIVISEDGISASYDKLVIATGSSPFVIPVPGKDLPGVVTYRDLDDVEAMLDAAKTKRRAVVIGGGLLGLEAAWGLKCQGMEVTVLHLMPTLMERQLDSSAALMLERALTDRGITVMTKANTHAILGDTHVTGVALDDGTEIPCDIVCMAVGIRPSTKLAADAGLDVGRGIIVSDQMATSDPAIFALGECAEHRGQCYGLVAPLYEMAEVLADHLAGGAAAYEGSVTSTKLKVTGINLFSAGDFAEGSDREQIVLRDSQGSVYKRLVLENDRIVGVVLYGDVTDGAWFFQLMKEHTDVRDLRETLIFGKAFQGADPLDPMAAAAVWRAKPAPEGCSGLNELDVYDLQAAPAPNAEIRI